MRRLGNSFGFDADSMPCARRAWLDWGELGARFGRTALNDERCGHAILATTRVFTVSLNFVGRTHRCPCPTSWLVITIKCLPPPAHVPAHLPEPHRRLQRAPATSKTQALRLPVSCAHRVSPTSSPGITKAATATRVGHVVSRWRGMRSRVAPPR